MSSNISVINTEDGNIVTMLKSINNGSVILDMESALTEIVNRVEELSEKGEYKPGKLTVELNVRKDHMADNVYRISGKVKSTLPEPKRKESILFMDDRGILSRSDPRQHSMFVDG